MMPPLLATTVVGSYPQPEWLVDRELLRSRLVPRLAASEIWRVPGAHLEEAKNNATLLAIRDMERAGSVYADVAMGGPLRADDVAECIILPFIGMTMFRMSFHNPACVSA